MQHYTLVREVEAGLQAFVYVCDTVQRCMTAMLNHTYSV